MGPAGVMDQACLAGKQQASSARSGSSTRANYQVCDLADEEVHFSRNPLDSGFYYHWPANGSNSNNNYSDASHVPSSPTSTEAASFTDVSLLAMQGTHSNQTTGAHSSASGAGNADQLRSSRLLNSISSRLRRGSNYLNASKVVGQYLLGITIQNWSEFFNTSRMMRAPCTRHQLSRRLLANLSYFQGNYLCVSLILVIYCILTSPLLLLAIALYLFCLYIVTARSALGKQTRVFGYRLNLQQQYSTITMLSLPPLWIAGAPSALFWVIGASFFVVGLHAGMYANERALAADLPTSGAVPALGQQSSAGAQWAGYKQLPGDFGSQHSAVTSATKLAYYNHQASATSGPDVTRRSTHESLAGSSSSPFGLMSAYETAGAASPSGKRHSSSGYMPVALSQWISFGASSAKEQGPPAAAQRVPEVKIISQDYAGLGRVYEV